MDSRKLILTAACISALAGVSAQAATVLIDFGRADNPAGSTYNIASIPANGDNVTTGNLALFDTGLAATGWTVNVTENGSNLGGTAGSGADVSAFPAALAGFETEALEDSIFGNPNGVDPAGLLVTISGLDNSKTYDLLFYGSRSSQNSPDQTWSLTLGTGGASVVHSSLDNTTTVVDWDGLSTNGSGVIAFQISNGGAGGLALNFGQIVEVPEPGSLALLGLGGLLVASRRRRA